MYPVEAHIEAKRLFCECSYSYEEVAAQTGISMSQLKHWGGEEGWSRERAAFERDALANSRRLMTIKTKLLKEAEKDPNPQKIYAISRLLAVTDKRTVDTPQQDKASLFLEWMGNLIEYLKERDGEALRRLQPHIKNFSEWIKT